MITRDEERASDDGLGYYPDGVKRTLTDQQIEIFRHSEIQKLRGKRLQEEAGLPQADHGSTGHGPDLVSAIETVLEERRNGNPPHCLGQEFKNNENLDALVQQKE
jgi:hypothetical protein